MKIPPPPADPAMLGKVIPPPPANPDDLVADTAAEEMSTGEAILETGKELVSDAVDIFNRDAGTMIGAATGAAKGGMMGAPLGPVGLVTGVLGGAYLGGASGKAATEAVNATVNALAPLTGVKSADPKASLASIPAAAAAGGEEGVLMEGGGRAAGGAVTQVGGLVSSYLKTRNPQALRAIEAALSKDIMPSMTEITQSRTVAKIEGALAKIPIFGRHIVRRQAEREAAFNAMRAKVLADAGEETLPAVTGTKTYQSVREHLDDKLAERQAQLLAAEEGQKAVLAGAKEKAVGGHAAAEAMPPRELGEKLGALRNARLEIERDRIGDAYAKYSDAVPPQLNHVPPTQAVAAMEALEQEFKHIPKEMPAIVRERIGRLKKGPVTEAVGEVTPGAAASPRQFGDFADIGAEEAAAKTDYTFKEMSEIISNLTQDIKDESLKANPFGKAAEGGTTKAGKMLGAIKDAYLRDFQAASARIPSGPAELKAAADSLYKIYKGTYFSPDAAALAKAANPATGNPSVVFDLFAKPRNSKGVEALYAAVGEEGADAFRRKLVDKMILGADGTLLAEPAIAKNLARYDETLKAALKPEQYADLIAAAKQTKLPELPKFLEPAIETHLRRLIEDSAGKMRPPTEIVDKVLGGDEIVFKALKKVVGEEGMQPYRREWLKRALGEVPAELPMSGGSTLPPVHQLDAAIDAMGRKMDYLFPKETVAEIRQIGKMRTLLESQKVLDPRGMSFPARVATGALFAAGAGGAMWFNPVVGSAILVTPELASRFYVSKVGRDLLLRGMSPGAAKNAALSGRISAYALNAMKGQFAEEAEAVGGLGGAIPPPPAVLPPSKKEMAPLPPPSFSPASPAPSPENLSPEARQLLGL